MEKIYYMPEGGGQALECHVLEAPKKNQEGYGIFWTVQEFEGPRRIENIRQVNGFAIDIDTDTKEEQLKKIRKGLYPTWIIESKRGFHVYWLFEEPIQVVFSEELKQRYQHTMNNRLVPYYGADNNAKDLARILRAPHFLHLKDPKDPFMIKVLAENPARYTWDKVDSFYPDAKAETEVKKQRKEVSKLKLKGGTDVFDRIWKMNQKEGLELLSGTEAVRGDVFEFKRNSAGTQQIIVNGKSTSCWIDSEGKIGSHDKGGPTIWQWLYWYSHDHKQVYKEVKKYVIN